MPSKKAARQKKHGRKPITSTPRTLESSIEILEAGTIEQDPRQLAVAIETPASSPYEEQDIEASLAECGSQKSFQSDASSDEGSSSSGCNTTTASHGSRTTSVRISRDCCSIKSGGSYSSCSSSIRAADDLATSQLVPEGIDTCDCSDAQTMPIWVDNGNATAWLLVMPPPAPCKMGIGNADATSIAPKDAILLGPYVAVKNTFLDETGISERLRSRQLFRSRSIGACRCGFP